MYVVKNLNNLFCENQKALELLYLAWNTKFVQIKSLVSKLTQPLEVIDFSYIYIVKTKIIFIGKSESVRA
jgi:hypothetical protein